MSGHYVNNLTGDFSLCFSEHLTGHPRKYINVLNLMSSLNSTEDMYRFTSLHYEKLVGDKVGRESVRVNDQYRIEFRTEIKSGERIVTVCNILELSNHYK